MNLTAAIMLLCSTSSTCPSALSTDAGARMFGSVVAESAREHGVPTDELVALWWHESRFSPSARSPQGATGIAQVLRRWWWYPWCVGLTYRCLRVQSHAGARAYAHYRARCGSVPRAVRAYRSGRCGPPVAATRRVLRTLRVLRGVEGA